MKIWLDDERVAPEGWHWVKTAHEVILLLADEYLLIEEISLDHDLGDFHDKSTGYTVLLWIEEQVFTKNYRPPIMHVHTANASARIKMLNAVMAIERQAYK